jgi:hypothetical protein
MRELRFPRFWLSVLVLLLMGFATDANAIWPGLMNYQGRLTDNGGSPVADGTYNITFNIYQSSASLWSESHSVTTNNGFFSVELGSNGSPLPVWIFGLNPLWLGITVGTDPEITPRTRLTSVPHAYGVASIDGAEGGNIQGSLWLMNEYATSGIVIAPYGIGGGALQIERPGEGAYFTVDGNYNNTSETRVTIGYYNPIRFCTDLSGDSKVQLPDNSIHSAEILDEPGLASEVSSAYVSLSPGMTDIETVSITIPTDGYILVQGDCYVQSDGATSDNHIRCQIDEESGGSATVPYFTQVGQWGFHSTDAHSWSISTHRLYYKTVGTYTFRLEGEATSTAHTTNAINATVTALYIPSGYDEVKSYVFDPAGFENAVPLEVATDRNPALTETMYEVDLRELEMKALRARAEALKAERDLYDAQLRQRTIDKDN